MIGKIISHYKILEKLGEGGMGVVYKAEDTKLKREVAIKFLPHHITLNKEEHHRFEIEAQAIARSVIQNGDDGTYMIIDFGKMRTGLGIVSRGLLSFTSTLDVVGDTLTEAIAEHFSVSTEKAERIKNESDFIKNKDNSELFLTLMKTIGELKDEIERHYRYWNTRIDKQGETAPRIDKIILCGGSSNVVGLREYLSGSL
ncbi:MAG: pilus assembly protein PilM, partial [Bacteroidetes bacterium]|nr:pilus assembly protein PilM [Bacteroidota bacterium]